MDAKFTVVLVCALVNLTSADIMINEFHYDNSGGDTGEFIEIVSSDPIADLNDVTITLYTGNNGTTYKTLLLSDFDSSDNPLSDGYYYYSKLISGIQNGSPDGIAISLNGTGTVIEFISYEGTFTATDGVADGTTSTDIVVAETTSTPTGSSLQRLNFGDTWILTEGSNTMGEINTGCTVPVPGSCLLAAVGLGLIRVKRRL